MTVAVLFYAVLLALGVFDGMGAWSLIFAAPFALAVWAMLRTPDWWEEPDEWD